MRVFLASICCLLAACTAGGPTGFAAADYELIRTNAKPGTVMTTATLKGTVETSLTDPKLTVAAIGVDRLPGKSVTKLTLASSRLQGGRYSLSLPQIPELENDSVSGFHDLWQIVFFVDNNGNGDFDRSTALDKIGERDVELPTVESLRLAYKGYTSTPKSFVFLPHNDLAKGWVAVVSLAFRPKQYHQDFTRDFTLVASR